MSLRKVTAMTGRSGATALLLALAVGFAAVPGLSAQGLELVRELPAPAEADPCADVVVAREAPDAEARDEAQGLLQAASEARILGDVQRAAALLAEAVATDPTLAEGHLQLARALEEVSQETGAAEAYCRYLALAPQGPDRQEAEAALARLVTLPEDPIPPSARTAFEEGVGLYDGSAYDDAVREFSRALVERPGWAEAHLNRGLAYLAAGREGAGLSDLEQYLELAPDGAQATAVAARLAAGDAPPPSLPNPSTALAAGLVPGMGHFYGGDPGLGTLYLLAAGASAATGIFYTRLEVDCLLGDVSAGCPPEFVADERTERPLLAAGLGAAAGITVLGAVHAFRRARGRRADAASRGFNGEFSYEPAGGLGAVSQVSVAPLWGPFEGRVGASFQVRF
jgi:tetratricopeptide (TPR) repeat protein